VSWGRPKVRKLDEVLLRRLPPMRRSRLDRSIAILSRSADRAVLWCAVAALIPLVAPRTGRRAAGRGLLSLAVASALVNGPLKLVSKRSRPTQALPPQAARWVRQPMTYSFPSGHSASAFAFATAVTLELPQLALPLGALAFAVAYSRVLTRVHYPSDVLVGSALGVATALGTRRFLTAPTRVPEAWLGRRAAESTLLGYRDAVLVTSPHAGRAARGLRRARRALESLGIQVLQELPVDKVESLEEILLRLREQGLEAPLVIAAGGDGTVGAVANELANSGVVMGVIPLGTSNDFARSLGIPRRMERAVALLRKGKVSTIDLGRMEQPGGRTRHFVHAATAGLNVSFAKLATEASFRKRLGRLAYVVAAMRAFGDREPFHCRLVIDGRRRDLELIHLSVINAPVFGGFLGLRMRNSSVDDRLLDVLAVENIPFRRVLAAALEPLLRVRRRISGIHSFHVSRMDVDSDRRLEVALDGEVCEELPAAFTVAGEALRVVTPLDFVDVDDPQPAAG
jgi:undecaprenyl-diphosphatase